MADFKKLDDLRKQKKIDAMKDQFRGGALSSEEQRLIREFCDKGFDDIEIGEKLNRRPGIVKKFRFKELIGDDIPVPQIELKGLVKKLRDRPEWQWLRQEFTATELAMFEHEYAKIMSVIEEDINPAEEISVFDLVKVGILLHRNMVDKKEGRDQIERLQTRLAILLRIETPTQKEVQELSGIETTIRQLQASQSANTTEYVKLSEKRNALSVLLKTTRDQRITKIENTKRTTYVGLLKDLANEDVMRREGLQVELLRRANLKAKKDLGRLHTFADGSIDRCLLTSDTVNQED